MSSVIRIENLTKYYGKSVGVSEVTLEVGQGEIFGFIGPNGAGKSTTIRTLLGLLRPSGGTMEVFGLDPQKETAEVMSRIGYLPADVLYYQDETVREILDYSAHLHGLTDMTFREHLEERLQVQLDKRFSDLSTGNKKKVGVVQALMHRPDLLILDEPTTGLDPLMQQELFHILHEVNESRGTTIFFSSHILDEVQKLCDKVALIRDGKVLFTKTMKEVMKTTYKLCRVEFEVEGAEKLAGVDGVTVDRGLGKVVEFKYTGKMQDLINALKDMQVVDMTISDPELEQIFMEYYKTA